MCSNGKIPVVQRCVKLCPLRVELQFLIIFPNEQQKTNLFINFHWKKCTVFLTVINLFCGNRFISTLGANATVPMKLWVVPALVSHSPTFHQDTTHFKILEWHAKFGNTWDSCCLKPEVTCRLCQLAQTGTPTTWLLPTSFWSFFRPQRHVAHLRHALIVCKNITKSFIIAFVN